MCSHTWTQEQDHCFQALPITNHVEKGGWCHNVSNTFLIP